MAFVRVETSNGTWYLNPAHVVAIRIGGMARTAGVIHTTSGEQISISEPAAVETMLREFQAALSEPVEREGGIGGIVD